MHHAHTQARFSTACKIEQIRQGQNEPDASHDHASSEEGGCAVSTLDFLKNNNRQKQATLTQQGFYSTTSRTEEDAADDHFAMCAAIKVNYVFHFIGLPGTPSYNLALKDAIHAHSMGWTHSVEEIPPGKVPLDLGGETYKIQIATALRHNEPIQPFTSNIVTRLKARRAKGSKCTEDEMLADAERYPWEFDESSSNESSHSDDEDEDEPAAKKKRTYSP